LASSLIEEIERLVLKVNPVVLGRRPRFVRRQLRPQGLPSRRQHLVPLRGRDQRVLAAV